VNKPEKRIRPGNRIKQSVSMADRKAIARRLWGKKCCTQAASISKGLAG
jgi:hypothetical protein